MKLTKYEHACLTIEKDGQLLVIDPGNLTTDFIPPEHVVAVIVTHAHGDHFDPDILAAIYNKNPDSLLIAEQTIIDKMPDHRGQAVHPGDNIQVGEFELEFFGGQHALIHGSIPTIDNLGVLVNELLYYPGDSLIVPPASVDTLALPVSAPWLKISEAMDFLIAVRPRLAFPVHDALLSPIGATMTDTMLGRVADQYHIEYRRLQDSIDI
jgi:L-ascorbate metabolism protein UlaG (beta-lactamase superfamily)